MMAKKKSFTKREILLKLVTHEAQRVFKDRLIDEVDYKIFDDMLKKIVQSELNLSGEDLSEIFSEKGLIFCNFNMGENL